MHISLLSSRRHGHVEHRPTFGNIVHDRHSYAAAPVNSRVFGVDHEGHHRHPIHVVRDGLRASDAMVDPASALGSLHQSQ